MMNASRTWRLRSFGVACALVAALASVPATAQTGGSTVSMVGISFAPAEVHVAPGTMVIWTNSSQLTHTVTAADGSSDSGDVTPGAMYTQEFDTPGTYPYYCQYHGAPGGQDMSGVIVVDG
jgi:plastocyanin